MSSLLILLTPSPHVKGIGLRFMQSDQEYYIVLDIPDTIDTKNIDSTQIIGIASDTPYLRIDNYLLKGKWEEKIGENLIFCKDERGKDLKFLQKSTKCLRFEVVDYKEK